MATFNLIADADSNVKLAKIPANAYMLERFRVYALTLAPHSLSGYNVCAQSTAACRKDCVISTRGNANLPNVKASRIRKTRLMFEDPTEFHRQLRADLDKVGNYAELYGFTPLFRLDVGSDIGWMRYARDYPEFRFYGYTKVYSRFSKPIPPNMHLTYSWNDQSIARGVDPGVIFQAGHNIAAVVSTLNKSGKRPAGKLPGVIDFFGYRKRPVDGDAHDWRIPETDGRGRLVALRFKGSAAARREAIDNGFVIAV